MSVPGHTPGQRTRSNVGTPDCQRAGSSPTRWMTTPAAVAGDRLARTTARELEPTRRVRLEISAPACRGPRRPPPSGRGSRSGWGPVQGRLLQGQRHALAVRGSGSARGQRSRPAGRRREREELHPATLDDLFHLSVHQLRAESRKMLITQGSGRTPTGAQRLAPGGGGVHQHVVARAQVHREAALDQIRLVALVISSSSSAKRHAPRERGPASAAPLRLRRRTPADRAVGSCQALLRRRSTGRFGDPFHPARPDAGFQYASTVRWLIRARLDRLPEPGRAGPDPSSPNVPRHCGPSRLTLDLAGYAVAGHESELLGVLIAAVSVRRRARPPARTDRVLEPAADRAPRETVAGGQRRRREELKEAGGRAAADQVRGTRRRDGRPAPGPPRRRGNARGGATTHDWVHRRVQLGRQHGVDADPKRGEHRADQPVEHVHGPDTQRGGTERGEPHKYYPRVRHYFRLTANDRVQAGALAAMRERGCRRIASIADRDSTAMGPALDAPRARARPPDRRNRQIRRVSGCGSAGSCARGPTA